MTVVTIFFPSVLSHFDCVCALRLMGFTDYQWVHRTEFDVFLSR